MTGGRLWIGYKCMRGTVSGDDDLFMGTAKAMEGILADECYSKAEKGCGIHVLWQNGDSSSQKSVEKVYGEVPKECTSVGVTLEELMEIT